MRIAFVGPGRPDRITGGLIYNRRLVQHFRECGDDVELIDARWRGYGRSFLNNWSADLRRSLAKPFDVVLESEFNHISLLVLNRRITAPKVSIVHHLTASEPRAAWKNAVVRAFEGRYLAAMDAHILNSESTRAAVESLVGHAQPSVIAFPGADRLQPEIGADEIEADEIEARAAEPGPLRLLYVGNLVARKGLVYLLRALATLPATTARLDVVGSAVLEPAYAREVERTVAALGLADRVTLLGELSDADLTRRYRASQLLVVPSVLEGFGMVYAEGMGFGLPAISAASGARAIIEEGVNGWLTAPGAIDELAELIGRLSADRGLLAQMSLAAKARFSELPTWEETTARVRAFLVGLT